MLHYLLGNGLTMQYNIMGSYKLKNLDSQAIPSGTLVESDLDKLVVTRTASNIRENIEISKIL